MQNAGVTNAIDSPQEKGQDRRPPLTDFDVTAILGRRDVLEIERTVERLKNEKRDIEAQLASDHYDMMADRADLLKRGENPRTAQMQASAETDFDWRKSATIALKARERQLAMLKLGLKALRTKNGIRSVQEVVVYEGLSARSLGDEIRKKLALGSKVIASIYENDGVVVVYATTESV